MGIAVNGGIMSNVIDRNTTIPCRKEQTYTTSADGQTQVAIEIFEGERRNTKDNHELGKFDLHGITPAPKGEP